MKRHQGEIGLTLAEVLIAATIFSLISLTAYALIFRAQATHEQLDADASQQRTVRFAVDQMVETIRSAGAGVNPSGDVAISDELIEGAWESAIFVRADFDGQREPLLEGSGAGERNLVTTGNDEIVGYILGRAGVLPHSVSVQADLTGSGGRRNAFMEDGLPLNEETRAVAVSAVSLADQTEPPYQLIRVWFNADGDVVREVVAADIFRLQFRYYDQNGAELDVALLGWLDGVGGVARRARSEIRRIEIDLVGMSERPVREYHDPFLWVPDPPAAKRHRKFPLSATVELDNAQSAGRDHGPVPSAGLVAPSVISACHGHCNRIIVNWPAIAGVDAFQVLAVSGADSSVHDVVGATSLVYTAGDPEGTFTFSVRSWDPAHNAFSDWSPSVSVVPSHQLPANTPAAVPGAATVVQDGANYALRVSWERSGENVAPLPPGTCLRSDGFTDDPVPPFDRRLVDLETYEVHRARAESGGAFEVSSATRVDHLDPNSSPMAALSLSDHLASPCQPYFYRVRALDACDVGGESSTPMALSTQFDLPSGVVPEAPSALSSNPPVEESVIGGAEVYVVSLEWPAVTTTAAPDANQVAVAHYIVERSRRLAGGPGFVYDGRIDVYESNRVVDVVPRVVSAREASYRYSVLAQFDCTASGLRTSEPSPSFEVPIP